MGSTAERLSLQEIIRYQKIIATYERVAEDMEIQGNKYAMQNAIKIVKQYQKLLDDDKKKADA